MAEIFTDLSSSISLESLKTALIIIAIVVAVPVIFTFVCYILRIIAIDTMTKRNGLFYGFVSLLPLTNYYVYGKLADTVSTGSKNKAKTLLSLAIAKSVVLVFEIIFIIVLLSILPGIMAEISGIIGSSVTSVSVFVDIFKNAISNNLVSLIVGISGLLLMIPIRSALRLIFNVVETLTTASIFEGYGVKRPYLLATLSFFISPVGAITFFAIRNRKGSLPNDRK